MAYLQHNDLILRYFFSLYLIGYNELCSRSFDLLSLPDGFLVFLIEEENSDIGAPY